MFNVSNKVVPPKIMPGVLKIWGKAKSFSTPDRLVNAENKGVRMSRF